MNFFEWLTTKRKTLSTMNVTELRSQEMLLENERNRMQAKVGKLAADKQKIIDKGAHERTPELRRMLAQQYDSLHTEQMMYTRQLNVRSKELLTVARLRMLRESSARTAASRAGGFVGINEKDLATIERLIENESISAEMYQERLDEILQVGHEADKQSAMVSDAGKELLQVWEDMDAGLIKDNESAFDEAERRMRERKPAAE